MIELPSGRVFDTAHRDLLRSLVRGNDPGPPRPTKTLGGALMAATAAPDPQPEATAAGPPVLPLIGGWSLTTDPSGALVAVHDDGSRAVLATRTPPTPEREDTDHG